MADIAGDVSRNLAPNQPEIGVSGLRVWSGYVNEEFLKELQGEKGRRTLREMSENDSIVGAVLAAIGLVLRAVKWRTEPPEGVAQGAADDAIEFVDSLWDDMSHTWEDFLSEVLTMLVYGWQYSEIVVKQRVGPEENDPTKRSKYTDGKIGIRKLAPRSQDTLLRWEIQEDGGVAGLWQQPWTGNKGIVFIPIERALLFKTTSRKNNPEGASVLRTAYRSWYKLKNIEDIEAIGIERELAGLPVVKIPAKYLRATASVEDKAVLAQYVQIARDVKFNEQGGIVVPSDMFNDKDGNPVSGAPQVVIELLSAAGERAIDVNMTIARYQRNIARSVLADFIMLGQDKGAFNLSESKEDLFFKAIEAILQQVAAPINRFLIPRIWDLNGMDRAVMPRRVPGNVAPEDLEKLGTFIQNIAAAGAELFPDDELENHLRERADLPQKSQETMDMQDERRQEELDAAAKQPKLIGPDGQPIEPPQPGDNPPNSDNNKDPEDPLNKGFDPSEPRDAGGKWTSGAAGAGGVGGLVGDVIGKDGAYEWIGAAGHGREVTVNGKTIKSSDLIVTRDGKQAGTIKTVISDATSSLGSGSKYVASRKQIIRWRVNVAGHSSYYDSFKGALGYLKKTADLKKDDRATKDEANYRDGTEERHCGICTMFRAPHGCISVKGDIDPAADCDYYEAKTDA